MEHSLKEKQSLIKNDNFYSLERKYSKKKRNIILTGFFLAFAFLILSFSRGEKMEIIYQGIEDVNKINMVPDTTLILSDLGRIKQVAEEVALSHEYKLHEFDCTNFSIELVGRLKDLGYKAICLAGNNWNFEYTNHTWVRTWTDEKEIDIESTTGEIIDNPKEQGYDSIWEDYCW